MFLQRFLWACLLLPLSAFSTADMVNDEFMERLSDLAKTGKENQFISVVRQHSLINKADSAGHTPLFASLMASPSLTEQLLKMGGNLNHQDRAGFTPLMIAAVMGYPEMANKLLQHGANIKLRNEDGHSALSIAAMGRMMMKMSDELPKSAAPDHQRWLQIVSMLIEKGADVNVIDNAGGTPLFYAISIGDLELCRTLIKSGADVNYRLEGEISMLQYAKEIDHMRIANLLADSGASN